MLTSRSRKNDWTDARHTYDWVRLDDQVAVLRQGAMSLKKFWGSYGGRWTRLRTLIQNHRGAKCEKCGAEGVTLEAHEVWEHIRASSAGYGPKEIKRVMKAHHEQLRGPAAKWKSSRRRALVRELVDIKMLCHFCHDESEHSWMGAHYGDFIFATHYAGLCVLPDYKTYSEWEAAMKDEAEIRNEDDRYYSRPYPEE